MSGRPPDSIDRWSEKDRFDAVMALVDFRLQRIRDRRENEWKVTLGFWALLAASPLYVTTRPPILALAIVLSATWALFGLLWLRPLMLAHRADSDAMFADLGDAAVLAGQPRPQQPARGRWQPASDWWGIFQIVATAVLALVAGWLIQTGYARKLPDLTSRGGVGLVQEHLH